MLGFLFLFPYLSSKEVYVCFWWSIWNKSYSFDTKSYFNVNQISYVTILLTPRGVEDQTSLPTLSAWSHMLCTYDMCIFFSEWIYFYFQSVSGRRETFLSLRSKYLKYCFLWFHSILNTASLNFMHHQAGKH